MHALDNPKIDTRIWDRLAVNVLRSGPAAISRALDQTMYPVPNVSGAQGRFLVYSPAMSLLRSLIHTISHTLLLLVCRSAVPADIISIRAALQGRHTAEHTHGGPL